MPSVLLFIYFCFVLLKDVKKGIIQIVVILQIFIYLTLWNTSLRLIYPTSVVAICIFVYRKCRKRRLVIYRSKKGKYPISLILISVLTSISYLISQPDFVVSRIPYPGLGKCAACQRQGTKQYHIFLFHFTRVFMVFIGF